MGKKKWRIKNRLNRNNKSLLLIISLILFVGVVIATAPTIPTVISPTNNSVFFSAPTLACSGSTGGSPILYQFRVNDVSVQFNSSNTYNIPSSYMEQSINWTCYTAISETNSSGDDVYTQATNYYNFDTQNMTSSTILVDPISGNNLTRQAGVTSILSPQLVNLESWYFDGSAGDYADFSSIPVSSGNFSISLWFYTNSLGAERDLLSIMKTDTNAGFTIAHDSTGEIIATLHAVATVRATGAVSTGAVHNLIYVYNSTGTEKNKIYIDGVKKSVSNSGSAIIFTGINGYRVGERADGNNPYNGYIDELSIYNGTTLNDTEIQTIYNLGNNNFPLAGVGNDVNTSTPGYVVNYMNFTQQDSGNALNIQFINESGGNNVNGALNLLSLLFASSDSGDYSYSYINISEVPTYNFSLTPDGVSVSIINGSIRYSGSNFPQRTVAFSDTLTGGSLDNLSLYLLGINDGQYVTFQVVDVGGSPISGATITASVGSTIVSSGTTDSAGTITFWLDPNTQHTISASKTGTGSITESIIPAQTSYTITLGSTTTTTYTSPLWGITYSTTPTNIILNNNTVYNFSFTISSSYWNLTNYGLNLYNGSNLLNTSTGTTTSGGTVSALLDTNSFNNLTMNYFWNIDGNYTNQSKNWKVASTYTGALSIKNFFTDFSNYANVGFGAGFNSFGQIILSIAILIFAVGGLTYAFGIYSSSGIGAIVVVIMFALESVNLMPPLVRKYLLSVFVFVLWIGLFIQENRR